MTAAFDFPLRSTQSGDPVYAQLAGMIRDRVARGLLKPGERLPPIRDLARRLKLHANTVARSYGELERQGVVTTRRGGGTFVAASHDDPVLTAMREDRLRAILSKTVLDVLSLGYTAAQVQQTLAQYMAAYGRWHGQLTDSPSLIIVGSDDPALALLMNRLNRGRSVQPVLSIHAGSLGGLLALQRGEAHLAGVHAWDAETAQYNAPFIKRMLPGLAVVLVNLVHREQGLIVHSRNPKKIRALGDLAREGVTIVNRQPGSGTRLLLDYELHRLGIDARKLRGYEHEVTDHMAVAECVANQNADVGMGTLSAARALGLHFIPVRHERYDLVIPDEHYRGDLLRPLLSELRSDAFREAVDRLGGYDTSQTGDVLGRFGPRPGKNT